MKSQNIIIFGLSDLAELLVYHIEKDARYTISALCVDKEYISQEEAKKWGEKYPVVPLEELEQNFSPEEYSVIICVGYRNMNSNRRMIYNKLKAKGYTIQSYIHPTALVQTAQIGEGTIILENVTIGAFCSIGIGNIFYPCSHLAHHTMVGDFNFFSISCSVAGHVKVGNQCFFGNNCSTKNGIEIGDKTLIGAGAYLSICSAESDVIVPQRSVRIEGKTSDEIIL